MRDDSPRQKRSKACSAASGSPWRGRTVKTRFPHDPEWLESLSPPGRAWLQSFEPVRSVAARLDRSFATHDRRASWVVPESVGRMTMDHALTFIALEESRSVA